MGRISQPGTWDNRGSEVQTKVRTNFFTSYFVPSNNGSITKTCHSEASFDFAQDKFHAEESLKWCLYLQHYMDSSPPLRFAQNDRRGEALRTW